RLPGLDLPDAPDVERADGRNLRVAAGGRPIDQVDDRLAVAGDLDRAERDTVRDDVVPARVRDPLAGQPRAHAVRLGQHHVGAFQQRADAGAGETVGLLPEHDADRGLTPIRRPRTGGQAAWAPPGPPTGR